MERNDIKEDLEYVRNYFAQVRAAGKPKEHLQRCIRTLKYPEVLRDAGFVSYNGEDLSWYKVLNHEVLQTVYLYSDCGRFPLTLGAAAQKSARKSPQVPLPGKPPAPDCRRKAIPLRDPPHISKFHVWQKDSIPAHGQQTKNSLQHPSSAHIFVLSYHTSIDIFN